MGVRGVPGYRVFRGDLARRERLWIRNAGAIAAKGPVAGRAGPAAEAVVLKVDGVPRVRQRLGGQAITNAFPMTSPTGTVACSTYCAHWAVSPFSFRPSELQ